MKLSFNHCYLYQSSSGYNDNQVHTKLRKSMNARVNKCDNLEKSSRPKMQITNLINPRTRTRIKAKSMNPIQHLKLISAILILQVLFNNASTTFATTKGGQNYHDINDLANQKVLANNTEGPSRLHKSTTIRLRRDNQQQQDNEENNHNNNYAANQAAGPQPATASAWKSAASSGSAAGSSASQAQLTATVVQTNTNQHQHQHQQNNGAKRTLYACEDKHLQIECQPGELIHLIRAIYGRFSITTCNEFGHLGWSVNCSSPSSFEIIENSCQGKQACQLLASSSIFGDACPGTQKYLEVHYQCLIANGTFAPSQHRAPSMMTTFGLAATASSNVNKQPANSNNLNSNHFQATSNNINNKPQQQQQQAQQAPHMMLNDQLPPTPAFPPWMPPGVRPQPALPAHITPPIYPPRQQQQQAQQQAPMQTNGNRATSQQQQQQQSAGLKCPEIVWRQIRWPASEPGSLVRMACPGHTLSGNVYEPLAASLACLPDGHWAQRVSAARCQSLWLRNLTQRVEVGESPLAALGELAAKTRPTAGSGAGSASAYQADGGAGGLFGDDLVEIGRILRHLVSEDINEWLLRIADDKQRISFGRDTIQALIELVNNLAGEHHSDAWADLAEFAGSRQRVAGQLVQSLESGLVLFAALVPSPAPPLSPSNGSPTQIYSRLNENVFVSIRSIPIEFSSGPANKTIELTFPLDQQQQEQPQQTASNAIPNFNLLGQAGLSWWSQMDQRFNLHLQVNSPPQPPSSGPSQAPMEGQATPPTDSAGSSWQNLKVVYVMTRGLNQQMEPASSEQNQQQTGAKQGNFAGQDRWFVNSNLISISLVADPTYKSNAIQVSLDSPFELVFKHQDVAPPGWNSRTSLRPNRCVFWEPTNSDWLQDGCKLVESNRTHSTCACSHLTTFGLLTEWDPTTGLNSINSNQQQQQQQADNQPTLFDLSSPIGLPNNHKVHLESIENEIQLLANNNLNNNLKSSKMLYLSKMLDGHLFGGSGSGSGGGGEDGGSRPASWAAANGRWLVAGSCLACAAALALVIGASLYDRAHTSRLLASIPLRAAPSLLVTSNRTAGAGAPPNGHQDLAPHQPGPPPQPNYGLHAGSASSSSISHRAAGQPAGQAATTHPSQGQLAGNGNNPPRGSTIWHCQTSPLYSHATTAGNLCDIVMGGLDMSEAAYHEGYLGGAAPAETCKFQATRQLKVPVYLLCQLLAIQLLVLLMVITQQWFAHKPSSMVQPGPLRATLGQSSWLLVLLLFYLVASIACWLLAQFLKLNASLLASNSRLKKIRSGSMAASVQQAGKQAALQQRAGQLGATIGSQATNTRSSSEHSTSASEHDLPSDVTTKTINTHSTSCNYDNNQRAAGAIYHQQQQHLKTPFELGLTSDDLLSSPEQFVANYWQQASQWKGGEQPGKKIVLCFGAADRMFELILVSIKHFLPLLLSALYFWASKNNSLVEHINELTFVTTLASQAASWPLLIDATWLNFSLLIYLAPTICALSFALALWSLRSHPSPSASWSDGKRPRPAANPYGPNSVLDQQQQQQQQQYHSGSNPFVLGPAHPQKHMPAAASSFGGLHLRSGSTGSQSAMQVLQPINVQASNGLGQHGPVTTTTLSSDEMLIEKWRNSAEESAANHQPTKLAPPLYQSNQVTDSSRPKVRLAKLTCAMLIALLVLHTICWLSFVAHIRHSLESPAGSSTSINLYALAPISGHQSAPNNQWNSYKMLYVFAISNLLVVCLVCWAKRRHLVRASQQIGLKRFVKYFGRHWCSCNTGQHHSHYHSTTLHNRHNHNVASLSSGKSERHLGSAFYHESSHSNNNNNNQHHHNSASQLATIGASVGPNGVISNHQTKISPSSQSLFMISNSQSQLYGTNYMTNGVPQPASTNYGMSIAREQQQQQQHLYQPIYDDSQVTMNNRANHLVNTLGHHQQAGRFQHPNGQLHQQQHSFTLSRGANNNNQHQQQQLMMQLDANQTLKHQQEQQEQYYQSQAPNSRTLGYQRGLMMNGVGRNNNQPVASLKQNQGEAEGPLVALGNSGASSSVSDSSAASHQSDRQQHHHQMQTSQATFGPNSNQSPYERHLFSSANQQARQNLATAGANFRFNASSAGGALHSPYAINGQPASVNEAPQSSGSAHFRHPSQQLQHQLQQRQQQQQQQQLFAAQRQQMNQRSNQIEIDQESGHIYDTAQNCYSPLVQ